MPPRGKWRVRSVTKQPPRKMENGTAKRRRPRLMKSGESLGNSAMSTSSSAESIFFAALGKTRPAERAAYLDEACRDNADLRRQVERLLDAHPKVGSFVEEPLAGHVADEAGAAGD